jgi:hypothetical protein
LTKGTFTSADLTKFLTDNRVDLKDVTFSFSTTKPNEVTFFINADAVPDGKTDQNVADDIKTSATAGGNEGTAYVLSGTPSTTGFGNVVVVSFIGMLIALFM